MGSHRRRSAPIRAAITVTATGAVAAGGVGLSATAGHAASVAEVQAQVKTLQQQAEAATNGYEAAAEQLAALHRQVDALQSQTVAAQQSATALMSTLGPLAAAQYRAGSVDPALTAMLSQSPDQYLQRALAMKQFGRNEAMTLTSLKSEQARLAALRRQAADRLAQVQQMEDQAAALRTRIVAENRQAQALLAGLTFAQRQQISPVDVDWNVSAARIAALPRVTGRAGVAVGFAESKLGIYYQWGGTGNPGYDCSGLTQAAWKAAGVQLGRTTYDQVTDGYAVAPILANLQPGDLIFYNDNEHMAIYVGGGLVVHAPTTGQPVQYGPWNMLPIDAVRRVI